jgi:hypothetical protein
VTGDIVVRALGYHHPVRAQLDVGLDWWVLARVAIAGVAFGVTSVVFVSVTHSVKRVAAAVGEGSTVVSAIHGFLARQRETAEREAAQ